MPNEIRIKEDSPAALTITLASLANGSARQGDLLPNASLRPGAIVTVLLTSNASAPTAGAVYEVYLIRSDGTVADDNAGASDAAITIENAQLLGVLVVTATANKAFRKSFDTALLGVLGPNWTVAIKNSSGQALHATGGNHAVQYTYYVPEIQAA